MIIDVSLLKTEALQFPEPLKSMILSLRDDMKPDEFLNEFINLRRLCRILDSEAKKNGK